MRYTHETRTAAERQNRRREGKKITKSYLIQWLNPLSGGLISPKDISVPLKGSPDLKEDTMAKEWIFERKRKEIPKASRAREMDERRRARRGLTLTIHPLSGGNAREC